jgi:hypothetical protein
MFTLWLVDREGPLSPISAVAWDAGVEIQTEWPTQEEALAAIPSALDAGLGFFPDLPDVEWCVVPVQAQAVANDFPGHVPGHPYLLTRQQFATFANIGLKPYGGRDDRAVIASFWADIAAFEARRVFNPHAGGCYSDLAMSTKGCGFMRWEYITTSGTVLHASEWREMLTQPAPGYPGSECSGELPEPIFQVTIPADRDQPGRHHYEQLRNGGAYCS